ncbi:MAG: hypothetical protein ABIS69_12235, partial [Sediminibacterium sp.]
IVGRIRTYMQELAHPGEPLHHASFLSHYQAAFIFLMIPLAGAITWLVFHKSRYNFWEHLLINTYLAAQLNVLLVLISVFSLLKYMVTGSGSYSTTAITAFMTGFMFYYAIVFSGMMNTGKDGLALGVKLGLMCFSLASVYIFAMSFSGII